MSEPNPTPNRQQNAYTLRFMVVLSLICAIILSILASVLKEPQERAKELDRSREMLIAARILSPYGYFELRDEKGEYVTAEEVEGGVLKETKNPLFPSQRQILDVYQKRIQVFLLDDQGKLTTFKQAGIDEQKYVTEFRKTGYYKEPLKLIYKILSNSKSEKQDKEVEGYIIPVNGMGLWDAIYGFLAIKTDGDTVIGISWYDQKETPGLGANISEPQWQSQFPGKLIFQESADGKTNFATASLGIIVVKGKVSEVLGNVPKALSAVDGMAGATLTGNGVMAAYRDVLVPYRPFFIHLHEEYAKNEAKQE